MKHRSNPGQAQLPIKTEKSAERGLEVDLGKACLSKPTPTRCTPRLAMSRPRVSMLDQEEEGPVRGAAAGTNSCSRGGSLPEHHDISLDLGDATMLDFRP